jgi:hypothetical protein
MSSSAFASRPRIFSTTGSGAFPRNASLPSFASACAFSFSAAARSFVSRLRSAATSIVPERSSATSAPSTGRVAVAVKPSPSG